jgi:large subunit ribosomal protein L29
LKADQVRALGDEEIRKKLEEAHEELFKLRFQLATRQLTNHRELSKVKRDIARMRTIVRQRELGAR